jgi:hypothetical protein
MDELVSRSACSGRGCFNNASLRRGTRATLACAR